LHPPKHALEHPGQPGSRGGGGCLSAGVRLPHWIRSGPKINHRSWANDDSRLSRVTLVMAGVDLRTVQELVWPEEAENGASVLASRTQPLKPAPKEQIAGALGAGAHGV